MMIIIIIMMMMMMMMMIMIFYLHWISRYASPLSNENRVVTFVAVHWNAPASSSLVIRKILKFLPD